MKTNINLSRHGCYSVKSDDGCLLAIVLCAPSLDRVTVVWTDKKERILFKYCSQVKMSINEAKVWLAMQRAFGFECPPNARPLQDRTKALLEINGVPK